MIHGYLSGDIMADNSIEIDLGTGKKRIELPNYASEETLRDLVRALTGSSSSPSKGRKAEVAAIQQTTTALDDFDSVIDLTSDTVAKSGKNLGQTFDRAGEKAGRIFDSAVYGLDNLSGSSSESGKALEKTANTVSDLTNKAMDALQNSLGSIGGPITQSIVGLFTGAGKFAASAGAALMGFYVGQMEGLSAQQRELYDSGVFFANGIDDAAKTAGAAGITLGDLANAGKDAKESLRLMSGGSAGGLQTVSKVFGNFTKQQRENLYALGYTNEEVLSSLADLGASASTAGKQLSFEELQAAAEPYLKNLKEISRITGESVKEQRSQQEARRRDLFVQNQLMDLAPEQAKATETFINNLPKVFQGFALSGKTFDSTTGYIVNTAMPSYSSAIKDITDQLKAGTIDVTTAQKQYETMIRDPRIMEEMRANTRIFGQVPAEMYGAGSAIATTSGEVNAALRGQINAANATGDALSPQGDLNKGIANFVDINVKMQNALQQTALSLTSFMEPAVVSFSNTLVDLLEKLPGARSEEISRIKHEQAMRQVSMMYRDLAPGSESQSLDVGSDTERMLHRLSDADLASMGLTRTTRQRVGSGTAGDVVTSVSRTETAQPQNQALGGIIPHMDPEGTLVRTAEQQNEAFVPLPDGRAIPVKMDNSAFKDMNDKLDLLARINGAMLESMNKNNSLTRQGLQLAT